MTHLPFKVDELREKDFIEWLEKYKEVTFLDMEKESEITRYQIKQSPICRAELGAIRFNLDGRIIWVGVAKYHYRRFLKGLPLAEPKPEPVTVKSRKKKTKTKMAPVDDTTKPLVERLIARDGHECFYCGMRMERHEMTIEHLLPKSVAKGVKDQSGAVEDIKNKALAHKRCNNNASNKSVVEKIKLRERMRSHGNEGC